jgi:MarR family transcriptional regulator, organic hydroperoxide resistance regulator
MVKQVPDYVKEAGPAALGARLRRLSHEVDGDARRLYAEFGIAFEQRWLGLLDLLSSHGPLTVGELAAALGISHPSVSQSRQSLAKAGLIAWEADAKDQRRRKLRLTEEGAALVARLAPLWQALDEAAIGVDREAGSIVAALARLEDVLRAKPLYERVRERLRPIC